MDTDSPFEGDGPDNGDVPSYKWIDEWLCEYVDGTMDPSLEAVFEKYVEANPDLKAHVERLQKTRELLCNCDLSKDASPDVEEEVCREVEGDVSPEPTEEDERIQGQPLAAFARVSSVAAALVVGFFVGAMVVGPLPSADPSGVDAPNQMAVDTDPSPVGQAQAVPAAPGPDAQRSPTPFVGTDSADATLTPVGMP